MTSARRAAAAVLLQLCALCSSSSNNNCKIYNYECVATEEFLHNTRQGGGVLVAARSPIPIYIPIVLNFYVEVIFAYLAFRFAFILASPVSRRVSAHHLHRHFPTSWKVPVLRSSSHFNC
ncbi:hypothetical protein RR46_11270 [Papilio xuthus]|uniref:Secreted protein n=1 Tax=Papilio xuthus TaxID=66420 RepID=A0A194PZI1_PAPXU|nr:hypothetical protein RR46_11270 [Papilio xuthus]